MSQWHRCDLLPISPKMTQARQNPPITPVSNYFSSSTVVVVIERTALAYLSIRQKPGSFKNRKHREYTKIVEFDTRPSRCDPLISSNQLEHSKTAPLLDVCIWVWLDNGRITPDRGESGKIPAYALM